MSQATTWGVQSAGPATMAQYAARDNAALDALLSAHRGASRPSYAVASTIWVKAGTAPVTDAEIYYFDGTNDILIATINESTNAITFAGLGTAAVLDVGTDEGDVVQLGAGGALPAVDGSLLTGVVQKGTTGNLTVGITTDLYAIGNSGTGTVTVSLTEEALQTLAITGSFTLAPPSSGNGVAVIIATTNATGGYTITTSGFTIVNGSYDNTANKIHRFIVTKIDSTTILDIDEVA